MQRSAVGLDGFSRTHVTATRILYRTRQQQPNRGRFAWFSKEDRSMREIGIGMVGYKFMGKAHSNAYSTVARFFDLDAAPVMRCLAGRSAAGPEAAAERLGWASSTGDWEELVDRDDVEIVDISAPSIVHRDVALRAAEKGKHIFCEKPLAFTVAEGVEMVRAAKKAGIVHMVGFNYRRVPALALARQLIEEGRIGRVHHVRATYLQDWLLDPQLPDELAAAQERRRARGPTATSAPT